MQQLIRIETLGAYQSLTTDTDDDMSTCKTCRRGLTHAVMMFELDAEAALVPAAQSRLSRSDLLQICII